MSTEPSKFRIPDNRLNATVRAAYDLSRPQGMGYLHFDEKPMTKGQAEQVIASSQRGNRVSLDYVSGRAVKLSIFRDDAGWFLEDNGRWFDHSASAWVSLKDAALSTERYED